MFYVLIFVGVFVCILCMPQLIYKIGWAEIIKLAHSRTNTLINNNQISEQILSNTYQRWLAVCISISIALVVFAIAICVAYTYITKLYKYIVPQENQNIKIQEKDFPQDIDIEISKSKNIQEKN